MSRRNSGRTSRMLRVAVAKALEGVDVMVVAANAPHAHQMFERVASMQTPTKSKRQQLLLEYGQGKLRFIAYQCDRVNERGFTGETMVDHYVFESLGHAGAESKKEPTV